MFENSAIVAAGQLDDVEEIARVWHDAWHEGHRGRVPVALIAERGLGYFRQRSLEMVGGMRIVRDGGRVAGLALVVADELQQLAVDARARGGGIGSRLVAAAEGEVSRAGHPEIWLAVVPGNAAARRLYAQLGWIDRGDEVYHAATQSAGTIAVPVRRYAKRLREPGVRNTVRK